MTENLTKILSEELLAQIAATGSITLGFDNVMGKGAFEKLAAEIYDKFKNQPLRQIQKSTVMPNDMTRELDLDGSLATRELHDLRNALLSLWAWTLAEVDHFDGSMPDDEIIKAVTDALSGFSDSYSSTTEITQMTTLIKVKINSGFGEMFLRNKTVRDYGYVKGGVTGHHGRTNKAKYLQEFAEFCLSKTAPLNDTYYCREGVVSLSDFESKVKGKIRFQKHGSCKNSFGYGGQSWGIVEVIGQQTA